MDTNSTILTDSADQVKASRRLCFMRGKSVALLCSSVDIQLSFCDLYLDINSGALHISYDSDDLMGVLEAESGVTIAIGHLTDALDQMINNICTSVGAQTDTPQEDQHAENTS